MEPRKALVPVLTEGIELTPAEVVERAVEQARLLEDIVNKTVQYVVIEGKKYLEVQAWQTIGAFNGIHATTDWVQPVERNGEIVGYEAKVTLIKNGLEVGSGIMTCGLDEFPCRGKEGEGKHKAARSAAQTWAESKAYRMNYAYIAVLAGYQPTPADEMRGDIAPSITEDKASDENWCPKHKTEWFKKGKMKWWAHPIADSKDWCSKPRPEEIQNTSQTRPKAGKPISDLPTAEDIKNVGHLFSACKNFFGMMPDEVLALAGKERKEDLTDPGGAWEFIKDFKTAA